MQIVIELSDETYKDIKEENSIYGINNGLSARITGKVVGAIQNGTPLPKGYKRLIDADKVKKDIIDWFMYTVNSKHNSIPKDCDELIKYITGWVTYAIDKTPTIIEVDE